MAVNCRVLCEKIIQFTALYVQKQDTCPVALHVTKYSVFVTSNCHETVRQNRPLLTQYAKHTMKTCCLDHHCSLHKAFLSSGLVKKGTNSIFIATDPPTKGQVSLLVLNLGLSKRSPQPHTNNFVNLVSFCFVSFPRFHSAFYNLPIWTGFCASRNVISHVILLFS